jgi:predicted RNase H-like HicB family nuclease
VSEPKVTVIYSEGHDGWVIARIREFPAAMSQGRTREEARENVLDALRELVFSYLEEGEPIPVPPGASVEELHVTLTA